MITIQLPEIDGLEEFEFVVAGERRITLSFNPENLSLAIPGGVDPKAIANTPTSFFLRTRDFRKEVRRR